MAKKNFIIFLCLFMVSFAFSFLLNKEKVNIPYFGGIHKKISVDIFLKKDFENILFNGKQAQKIIKIDKNHYIFENNDFKKINEISFNNPDNIEKLTVYVDKKAEFYKKIKKTIKINSSKTFFEKLSITFLSFFYNPQFYLIPYLILFLMFYKLEIKIKDKIYLTLILILSFLLRTTQINTIPFWDDEIYTIVCTEGSKLINLFNDPGNPPLYYIIFKLYRCIIKNELFWRYSSAVIGVLFNFAFWIYLKKTISSKTAKIGVFIVSISLVLIYLSQELRCYMLLMLFSILTSIFLFNFKGKNKILYMLSEIAILYTHFYGAFFILYNFIFGCLVFKRNKLKNFLTANFVAFLSYLPLIIYKSKSLTNDFNSWLKIPDLSDYSLVFQTFCNKTIIFVLFIILTIAFYKISNKKAYKIFISYNFLSIVFVFLGAVIFSYLIKPIFCYRYFYVVYPAYLALISLFASRQYKFGVIFNFLIIFVFALNSRINYQNLFCNHNLFVNFIKNDIDLTKNNYIFMSDTVKGYKKFEQPFKNKAKIIYLPVNKGIEAINPNDYILGNKNVSYILNLYLENNAIINSNKIELYKTPLGVYLKAIYE